MKAWLLSPAEIGLRCDDVRDKSDVPSSPWQAPQERKIIAHGANRGAIAKSTKPRQGRKNVFPPPGATPVAHQSYIESRYPDALPEDVRPEEAVQAMTAASHLREFVLAAREQKGNGHG
jgi:hypothetical protein